MSCLILMHELLLSYDLATLMEKIVIGFFIFMFEKLILIGRWNFMSLFFLIDLSLCNPLIRNYYFWSSSLMLETLFQLGWNNLPHIHLLNKFLTFQHIILNIKHACYIGYKTFYCFQMRVDSPSSFLTTPYPLQNYLSLKFFYYFSWCFLQCDIHSYWTHSYHQVICAREWGEAMATELCALDDIVAW